MAVIHKDKKILYIDDAVFYRRAISMLFQRNGFAVDVAENGFQALSMLENKKYDLVITDFEMPLMSGLEVLLVIRHKYSKTELPVITLTSNSETPIIQEFVKFGTNAFVIKSNNLNPLLKKADELTGRNLIKS